MILAVIVVPFHRLVGGLVFSPDVDALLSVTGPFGFVVGLIVMPVGVFAGSPICIGPRVVVVFLVESDPCSLQRLDYASSRALYRIHL